MSPSHIGQFGGGVKSIRHLTGSYSSPTALNGWIEHGTIGIDPAVDPDKAFIVSSYATINGGVAYDAPVRIESDGASVRAYKPTTQNLAVHIASVTILELY